MSGSMVCRRHINAAAVLIAEGYRYIELPHGVFSLAELGFHGAQAEPLGARSLREMAYTSSKLGDEESARQFRKWARTARRQGRSRTAALGRGE